MTVESARPLGGQFTALSSPNDFLGTVAAIQKGLNGTGLTDTDRQVKALMNEANTDGDDKTITKAELADYLQKLGMDPKAADGVFRAYNTNTKDSPDGLDAEELKHALTDGKRLTEGQGSGGGGEQPEGAQGAQKGGGGGHGGGAEKLTFVDLLMQLLDANGDGKVSEDEVKDFVKKYDKGGPDGKPDGKLDPDELKAAFKDAAKAKGIDLSDEQLEGLFGSNGSALPAIGPDGATAEQIASLVEKSTSSAAS